MNDLDASIDNYYTIEGSSLSIHMNSRLPDTTNTILRPAKDLDDVIKTVFINDLSDNNYGILRIQLPESVENIYFNGCDDVSDEAEFVVLYIEAKGLKLLDMEFMYISKMYITDNGKISFSIDSRDRMIMIDPGPLDKIHDLSISSPYDFQESHYSIDGLTGLKSLSTNYIIINQLMINNMDIIDNIECMCLNGRDYISDERIKEIHNMISKLLNIRRLHINLRRSEHINDIINHPKLEYLYIKGEEYSNTSVYNRPTYGIYDSSLNNLKYISSIYIGSEMISHIMNRCPNIETLELLHSTISVNTILRHSLRNIRFNEVKVIDNSIPTEDMMMDIDLLFYHSSSDDRNISNLLPHIKSINIFRTFSLDDNIRSLIDNGFLSMINTLELNHSQHVIKYIEEINRVEALNLHSINIEDIKDGFIDKFKGKLSYKYIDYKNDKCCIIDALLSPYVYRDEILFNKIKELMII